MASVSYSRAVAVAAMQAAFTSAWIAARELTPAKRRLARLAAVAAGAAGYTAATPGTRQAIRDVRSEITSLRDGEPVTTPDVPFDKRRAAVMAGGLGLTIAVTVGRRQLEKRWLARLTRDGHPHPTRALALRMAPVAFAAELTSQLADMYTSRDEPKG